ncbi:MAG: ABC transporter substrate-binding protein [Deltaproteobacteria bacterium]|nr:ABC transporter substrate-binding protein [Deltaproteobacteria bacterium]
MMQKEKTILTFLSLLLVLISACPSSAGVATDQIRATVDKALTVLKDPGLKSEPRIQERRDKLRQILYARFDFAEMAKRSLGSHWRRRTPKEQEEFVQLFTGLLEQAYIDRIESYNEETFQYAREILDGNFAEVESRILTRKGEEFTILYKTHLAKGEWKVYDVVIENISLVNNFRSQFNRVIANSSYEELVRRLKEKQEEFSVKRK